MMAEAQKTSQYRVAFALVCGLALCCTVMYITADGEESVNLGVGSSYTNIDYGEKHTERLKGADVAAVAGLRAANTATATATGDEEKTESWDVKKVGTIYTSDTPDGRVKLLDYFNKVEKMIATEVAGRKEAIEKIRTKMEKNREYNAKARASMRKELLTRMAENAKTAKDDLDHQMSITARKFAAAAKLENERNRATRKRARKTREIMRKNKKENAHNLHMAVKHQQEALATLAKTTNEKIKKTNANIAANAAHIKANAIKARKDLETAMGNFDKKMYAMTEEAKNARSALAQEAKTMDKKVRAMVNGKVKNIATFAAKNFQEVRATMAKDRHHADMMLAQASTKMKTALAAQKALQDKRYAQTVADIAATKKEIDDKVNAMKKDFKVKIVGLAAKAKHDIAKLDKRVDDLSGTIQANKLAQAKINKQVDDEIKRMIKTGNDREVKLSESDKALHDLMNKNKEDTEKQMLDMSNKFYTALNKIKGEMAKDRKYHEQRLQKETTALFGVLAKNKEAQEKINGELTAATKAAADEAKRALEEARHNFATRLGALRTTVQQNDEKANKKIEKLTGIVETNAQHDAAERKLLKELSTANALEMKTAVRDAVAAGEKRAKQVEAFAKDMNQKTQDAMNNRITTEIGHLTEKIHSDIEGLELQSKEARKEMRAELLTNLREESQLVKENLNAVISWANKKFVSLDEELAATEKEGKEGRDALKASIDEEKEIAHQAIADAIANQEEALMALKTELGSEIKKTNTDVAAYGKAVEKHANDVKAQMESNIATLNGKMDAAKQAADKRLKNANDNSVARHKAAIDEIKASLEAAKKAQEKKFTEVYAKMGEDRAKAAENLATSVATLNDKLAKHAALEDERFSKTVKDVKAFKKFAWDEVTAARAQFNMDLADVMASIKSVETKILGETQIIAKTVLTESAKQGRINKHVDSEIKRIIALSDLHYSENKNARGKIKEIMNKNKAVAAQEVADLEKSSEQKLIALRAHQAQLRKDFTHDLTKATEGLYESLSQQQLEQTMAIAKLGSNLENAKARVSLKQKEFEDNFAEAFTNLVGVETANHKAFEKEMEDITGVVYDWKKAADADRALIREEAQIMNKDLNKAITKAIQIGEAKAAAVLETGLANVDAMSRAMQAEIKSQVERMADNLFKTIQEKRSHIANNYLSLKGYAGAAQDTIIDYVQKGQGKGLSAIGDFLQTIAVGADIHTKPALGVSAGTGGIVSTFSGDLIPDVKELNKVNGLADEYYSHFADVSARWPYGLGKYLLMKMGDALHKDGVLTVGKKSGASGQWVYLNGHMLGLSHKMDEFEDIACRLTHYQDFLSKLSAKLPKKKIVEPFFVPSPEYDGK